MAAISILPKACVRGGIIPKMVTDIPTADIIIAAGGGGACSTMETFVSWSWR